MAEQVGHDYSVIPTPFGHRHPRPVRGSITVIPDLFREPINVIPDLFGDPRTK